ncbi:MAG: NAD(P)/FAD-dependent oxidoreductase [Campylobacterota bacterium]|nr:NAD(P)/FAD-dependent oxidoreductase [Campylobacterota bacterium]
MKKDIAIIGAGASGLFSSILLASKNFNITIYEKNNKVGKKLLTTGNGRCNITNKNIKLENFHSNNPDFIKYSLSLFDFPKCKKIFNQFGIEFKEGAKTRQYPSSLMASSVVELLEYEALQKGVRIILNSDIDDISFKNNKYIINNQIYDKIILAMGSCAMPKLGSSTKGYQIAKKFGHNIITPIASLVQLVSSNKNLDIISGVKIDGVVNNKKGDILFTKYGLSGSAILDISRDISDKLQYNKTVKVTIDTMPDYSKNRLIEILQNRYKNHNNKDIIMWLDGLINKKLAKYIIFMSKIPQNIKYAKFLTKKDIIAISYTLKNLSFDIVDTKGFDSCEVCAGGVDTFEINSKTMESKLYKNLFFTGEVLDVDGDCGGYNLHWAWASSYVLANNMEE